MTSGSVESTWIGDGLRERDALDDAAHLLVLVVALDERDAQVEHVGAAVDLVLGDLVEAVVVVGQQHLLGLARALRVDALADHRRARLLHERRRGDHRADVDRARRGARLRAASVQALGERADVVGRRAAAAADDAHVVALDEVDERLGELLGPLGEDRLAVGPLDRDAGVRHAGDRHRRVLAEEADRVAHVLGAGRAVQPDRGDVERLERRQHGRDVGAEQHLAAVGQQRDVRLDRDLAADLLHRRAGAEDRGLDLEDVLRGLDEDEVDAALDEPGRLLGERVGERAEGDVAERRVVGGGQEAGRSDRAGDEALVAGDLARDLGGAAVDLDGLVAQAPLVELQPAGLEGAGLQRVRAGLEEALVDVLDDVRAVEHEHLVRAAGQLVVLLEREVELLQRGAHPALEEDDVGADGRGVVAHRPLRLGDRRAATLLTRQVRAVRRRSRDAS